MTQQPTIDRTEFVARIRETFSQSVEAIIRTGRVLLEAKADLEHGEFLAMVENDLPFGARSAQMLMAITHDARLTNAKSVSLLPPAWGTLKRPLNSCFLFKPKTNE